MGQISLARLNRINCSMIWESWLITNNYNHYLSHKLYLYFKFFLPWLFLFNEFHFNKFWFVNSKYSLTIFNISPKLSHNKLFNSIYNKINQKYNNLTKSINISADIKILHFYIYSYNDNTYIFIIYINKEFIGVLEENKHYNNVLFKVKSKATYLIPTIKNEKFKQYYNIPYRYIDKNYFLY